jgi:hypothetical protein
VTKETLLKRKAEFLHKFQFGPDNGYKQMKAEFRKAVY